MTYKHDAIVRAWLDGKEIQYAATPSLPTEYWKTHLPANDCDTNRSTVPVFPIYTKFRVKPDTRKYRVMLWKDGTPMVVTSNKNAVDIQRHTQFDKWLTDWIEYEV